MCTTCGCGAGETRVDGKTLPEQDDVQHGGRGHAPPRQAAQHGRSGQSTMNYTALGDAGIDHHHGPGGWHRHAHPHPAVPAAGDRSPDLLPSTGRSRMLQIERDILARNDRHAADNRRRFEEQGIFALNLVSSPGSGKTSLLCRSIEALKEKLSIAVIEGDQQTSHDADRIRATGVPALQINTGKGCHLDAHMVGHAVHELSPADDSLLLIENVGNLVCPAAFDLGEAHKVVILSVTEGEDKPLKYSAMFHAASLMLLNKIDLLPYLSFDVDLAIAYARRVNPALQVMQVSATTGAGFDQWLAWLSAGCAERRQQKEATIAALRRRIVELEAQLPVAVRG
ncbi:MAG: hydrogenase nickel incorporation protein HypB [Candidatus Accumulibacter sp.]|uniref:hydrogenase nickel incorporation protein HypB n=1 Tax=Accumulibacter sp. TaxID=2053492 RepID=UPI0025D77ADC|nr:hydrogenase nickel incorporation protein HypB [Accumulibacter sp.]MCP5250060.1 hydrogenase nickel incorporation protein HypB [Accumulibacter sp.]